MGPPTGALTPRPRSDIFLALGRSKCAHPPLFRSATPCPTLRVIAAQEGAVGTITLNHPKANSYDLAFMRDLDTAIDAVRLERRREGRRGEVGAG